MTEKSGFFMSHNGDRRYNPAWLAEYIKALVTTGVYSAELAVSAAGGMKVQVASGRAWVEGYLYQLDGAKEFLVATAHGTLHRKDTLVVRLDMTTRTITAQLLTGTPAANPTAPPIVRDADTYDLKLAEIYVAAGTTAITQAMVTDFRLDNDVCGLTVCTVQEIPTSTFLAQMNDDFSAWFNSVKGILGTDEAGNLLQMIETLAATVDSNYTELSGAITALQTTIKDDMAISTKTRQALGISANAKLDDALYAAGKHVVLNIDFAPSMVGKAYSITGAGLTATVSGTVPSSRNIQVPVLATNCEYTATCNGVTVKMKTDEYYGVYNFAVAPPLSQCTPAEIGQIAAAGLAPRVWSIGDEIAITLSGNEVITVQIYDFNHDTLQAGGLAPITFGLKDCMATTQKMNNSDTNVNGWPGSAMYSYLNTTVYNKLPTAWKNIIKPVKKLTSHGNKLKTIQTSNDKLFLFCEEEIFGGTTYAVPGEGKQYPIFTDAESRKKKLSGQTSATRWWERSPYASDATTFCGVNSGGTPSGNYYASNAYGVAFGFCV